MATRTRPYSTKRLISIAKKLKRERERQCAPAQAECFIARQPAEYRLADVTGYDKPMGAAVYHR